MFFLTTHPPLNRLPDVLIVALFEVLQTLLVNLQKPFVHLLLDQKDVITGLLWTINGSSWVYKALVFQNYKMWTGPCVKQASNIPPRPPRSASLCLPPCSWSQQWELSLHFLLFLFLSADSQLPKSCWLLLQRVQSHLVTVVWGFPHAHDPRLNRLMLSESHISEPSSLYFSLRAKSVTLWRFTTSKEMKLYWVMRCCFA